MTTGLVQINFFSLVILFNFWFDFKFKDFCKKKSQHERIEWVNLSTCAETEKSTSERK